MASHRSTQDFGSVQRVILSKTLRTSAHSDPWTWTWAAMVTVSLEVPKSIRQGHIISGLSTFSPLLSPIPSSCMFCARYLPLPAGNDFHMGLDLVDKSPVTIGNVPWSLIVSVFGKEEKALTTSRRALIFLPDS